MSDTRSPIEVLHDLVLLHRECLAAKAVTGRFQTPQEYTAEHRFNAAAREAMPAIEATIIAARTGR
ncbi:MAG TPA: hypothetical protein VGH91_04770 [Gammaproteobacteria bacterium]|jgi:hypothetical protein